MKRIVFIICCILPCCVLSWSQDGSSVSTATSQETDYYQGASGYVKFRYPAPTGSFYIGNTQMYGEFIFFVNKDDGDAFYLDKIDDTRYLIRYGESRFGLWQQYVAPSIPAVNPVGDIHNFGKLTIIDARREGDNLITAIGTTVDLQSPNDYTYTFAKQETIDEKSYYSIHPEITSDLSDFGYEVGDFFIDINMNTTTLLIQGESGSASYKPYFAIEDSPESSPYIDFGDEKYVRIKLFSNPAEYLFEDGTSEYSQNTKGITYLGMYNIYQYPEKNDEFKLMKVGVSEGKTRYTIYSGGEGSGNGGGGYLTDASELAFDGSAPNPDYILNSFARLTFEAEPDKNSEFAFRRIERGDDNTFIIETATGYVAMMNRVPVVMYESPEIFSMEETPTANEKAGIADVDKTLNVYHSNGVLTINGILPGNPISIYNHSGQLVYQDMSVGVRHTFPLQERGFYIVVSGNQSAKVVVN